MQDNRCKNPFFAKSHATQQHRVHCRRQTLSTDSRELSAFPWVLRQHSCATIADLLEKKNHTQILYSPWAQHIHGAAAPSGLEGGARCPRAVRAAAGLPGVPGRGRCASFPQGKNNRASTADFLIVSWKYKNKGKTMHPQTHGLKRARVGAYFKHTSTIEVEWGVVAVPFTRVRTISNGQNCFSCMIFLYGTRTRSQTEIQCKGI